VKKILIIEDDASVVRGLEEALKAEHYEVVASRTGERGRAIARREQVDLILLDLKLPDCRGEDVCRDLRAEGNVTPILMLTSKVHEADKIVGLEIGADDYVTKPFSMKELLARIHALLRRAVALRKDLEEFSFGDVYLDFRKQEARKNGKNVALSVREYEILKHFILHEGEVISRDDLLDKVWGYENFPTTRTVDNYILSLRKKLEEEASHPRHLLTVHTAGYKFIRAG